MEARVKRSSHADEGVVPGDKVGTFPGTYIFLWLSISIILRGIAGGRVVMQHVLDLLTQLCMSGVSPEFPEMNGSRKEAWSVTPST